MICIALHLCFTSLSCPKWWYTWDLDSSYTISDTLDVSNYDTSYFCWSYHAYIRTFIYIIYLLLNTSWIHHGIISILIPTTPDPFFLWIARICFKTCLHPLRSLAYGVRWIPTERLEDLKMAISNVLFLNALDDFLVRIDDDFLLFLDHFLDVLLFHAFLDVPEPLLSYIYIDLYTCHHMSWLMMSLDLIVALHDVNL